MKTQLLTVSPAVVRAYLRETLADTVGSREIRSERSLESPSLPPPSDPSSPPDWHYKPSERPSLIPFIIGLVLSGGLHAYVLLGFNNEPVADTQVAEILEFEIEFMKMPPVEELDEPEIFDGNEQQEEVEPGLYVPMQADVPSIATDAVFVQKMDLQVPFAATGFRFSKSVIHSSADFSQRDEFCQHEGFVQPSGSGSAAHCVAAASADFPAPI